MSFNIGNQTGGVINNVAGNQRVSGTQHGAAVSTSSVREAVQALRAAVDDADLDEATSVAVSGHLKDIETEVSAQDPDRSMVGTTLDQLAGLLMSAGAVATAGQSLIGPIRLVASWVGSLGPAVAQLLA
ncbi:hypothetical protein [Arthrobacter sp. H20]|uniref:hypothetical protein n=1 Tax=Arthrobacter sp. H20 TaxID=1267981 RepID=UPI00047B22E3|nr:hypothetical protein [Arthrobacter sp. H20]